MRDICLALGDLAAAHPDVHIVFPVHLNPNVQEPAREILSGRERVHLLPPQEYLPFVFLMKRATIILTDSGGIQEEGPSLGKPVLVLRTVTERPEAVAARTALLVGPDRNKIVENASRLLTDESFYAGMSRARNPYGDGRAAVRTVDALLYRRGRLDHPPDDFSG